MEKQYLLSDDYEQVNQLYDECLDYLKNERDPSDWAEDFLNTKNRNEHTDKYLNVVSEHPYDITEEHNKLSYRKEDNLEYSEVEISSNKPGYETIDEVKQNKLDKSVKTKTYPDIDFNQEKEKKASNSSFTSERLRKLSGKLPKIIITQSQSSPNINLTIVEDNHQLKSEGVKTTKSVVNRNPPSQRNRTAYGEFPKRLVSKNGIENVALISNVPFEKIRLLNDTFHTLINLRWRWIVIGTVVVHFAIWLVFAVFWYIAAMAHYDFEPNPPNRTCVTGGKDFVTIFLASVEAQTTIGFGDRAIDEECPESIFLFIMQLILGTGLSGVLTCVVYAKLTRPEKLSRDGVGFSKKAVICLRDGKLCLMIRAWDLNYDHIICSEFSAHFITNHRTKEGEVVRYYARSLPLQQRQFLLWPVTLVHEIDETSPLYRYSAKTINTGSYEITVSLKGASASMGTYTQSQSSYLPKEIVWGHRFLPVIRYDNHKQKYVIEYKKLDATEPVNVPTCSAQDLNRCLQTKLSPSATPETRPNSFIEQVSGFQLERSSSFRIKSSRA